MTLVAVCKSWGRLPSEMGLCGVDDNLAIMIAYDKSAGLMQAWDNQEQERKTKK
jgi:hypothetical protein